MEKVIIENLKTKEIKKFEKVLDYKSFIFSEAKNPYDWNIVEFVSEPEKETPTTNKKTKSVGNGEGSLYYSEKEGRWIFQYYNLQGKRKAVRQQVSKGETVREFKARVAKIKTELNLGTYIEKKKDTVISILKEHIERKLTDGITSKRSYARDLETLVQVEKTCYEFCNKRIQEVTLKDIQNAKPNISNYAQTSIDKIWGLLNKAFKIASSPSRQILSVNIMLDEELKKPIASQAKKKVKPLTSESMEKLLYVLDHQEREHKYRNIVKMQIISGMRIGEVLARSESDYNEKTKKFNVHNTLTQDDKYNIIWSEHTKTYNKQTQIDEGQRYLPLDTKLFAELVDIIDEQKNKKIRNFKRLLFWDYTKNDYIAPYQVDGWLKRIDKKYHICKGKEFDDVLASHRLRHGAITHWRNIGLPMSVIQYLAGHVEGSDITDTVYIDTSYEFVKGELKKIV